MFRIGISAFTVTSLMCGLAPDATTLLHALLTVGVVLLSRRLPDPRA